MCDNCEDVAESKVDMLTLSPFREEEGITCGEMVLELLDVEKGSETCSAVRADYQIACCTAEFGTCLRCCFSIVTSSLFPMNQNLFSS